MSQNIRCRINEFIGVFSEANYLIGFDFRILWRIRDYWGYIHYADAPNQTQPTPTIQSAGSGPDTEAVIAGAERRVNADQSWVTLLERTAGFKQ
jgi:hypothetical protein